MHTSANDCESATRIDLGVTNKYQKVSKFTNTESTKNEDRLQFEMIKMPRVETGLFLERT